MNSKSVLNRIMTLLAMDNEVVDFVDAKLADGTIDTVQICPDQTKARNWGFDVTPARLVTGLLCERGICSATEAGILGLFPEKAK